MLLRREHSPPGEIGGIQMHASDNVAAVKAAYAAYANGDDISVIRALFADDVEVSGTTATGEFRPMGWSGWNGFVSFVAQIQEDWDHKAYEPVSVQGHGDWVVSLVHVVTVNRRSGKQVDTTMAHAMRFQGGRCVEFHEHIDRAAIAP